MVKREGVLLKRRGVNNPPNGNAEDNLNGAVYEKQTKTG